MARYTEQDKKIIEQYFETLRWTRKTGKLSDSIKKRQLEYFLKYDKNIVLEALKLHTNKYPTMKEEYTRGILRNLAREAEQNGNTGAHRQFNGTTKGLEGRDRAAADAIASRLGV